MKSAEASRAATFALLNRLHSELPELWDQAQVVGRWVWLELTVAPSRAVREHLRALGFHWNPERGCWQHPCGASRARSRGDPRAYYQVVPARALILHDALPPPPRHYVAREFKVVALRECPVPEQLAQCETPEQAAAYWRLHVATNPYFNPDCECFAVLLLNTRRRIKGHQLLTIGTLDAILVHPREVFRGAIVAAASAIVLAHNHPSGDPTPSEADLRVTRDLIRAGQLLRIDVLDHVILGNPAHASLRELGYWAA